NAQRVRAVLAVLKQQGVKPEEMQTSDLDVSTLEAKGGRVTGYKVSNQITVTLGETDRVGALLQTAVGRLRFLSLRHRPAAPPGARAGLRRRPLEGRGPRGTLEGDAGPGDLRDRRR